MTNSYKKRCSKSAVIREMQIKSTVTYDYISIRRLTIKTTDGIKCGNTCGTPGPLIHC